MDEKTEELRQIFVEAADEDTVTESQQATHGSLTEADADADEHLESVIAEMQEAYEFDSDLSVESLRAVVEGFYAGRSDGDLAEELDVTRNAVFRARMDLHLVGESDTDAPFDLDAVRTELAGDRPVTELAEELDVAASTVRRYRAVVRTEDRARRESHRYRAAFEDALPDAAISERLTADVREDGLEDATEGIETNVSF